MTAINSINQFTQAMGAPQPANFKPVEKVDVNIHFKDDQGQEQLMTLDEYTCQRGSDKFKTYQPTHISVISPDTGTNTTMAITDLKKSSIKTALKEAFNYLEINPSSPEVINFLKASASSIISDIRKPINSSGSAGETTGEKIESFGSASETTGEKIESFGSASETTGEKIERSSEEILADQKSDMELFSTLAKGSERAPETNTLRIEYWNKHNNALGNHVKALEGYNPDAQRDVAKLSAKIHKITREAEINKGGQLTPDQALKLAEYDNEANRIAGAAHTAEAERHAFNSQLLSGAITVAEFTRDAAQNTVSSAASAVPALKPLSVGLDASLAFIDSVGKGESLGSASLQASVTGLLSVIGAGSDATFKQEVAVMLGKVIAQATADLAVAYRNGEKFNSAEFTSKITDSILNNLVTMGLEKKLEKMGIEFNTAQKHAIRGAIEALASMIQSTFLSTEQIFSD